MKLNPILIILLAGILTPTLVIGLIALGVPGSVAGMTIFFLTLTLSSYFSTRLRGKKK